MSSTYGSEGSVDSEFSFERLDGIMEDFADPNDPQGLRFGHLVVPVYLRTKYSFEAQLITALRKVDMYPVIFVLSRVEQCVASLEELDIPRLSHCEQQTLQYSWFLSILEMNYIPGPPSGWKQSNKMFAWEDDLELPKKAFVVFQLDPYMSAECALALSGLVKWAQDVSRIPGARIRILTVSSLFGNGLLTDLAQADFPVVHYELPIPTHIDVTPDVSIDYAEGDEIFRRIDAHETSGGTGERHAVLFCPPAPRDSPINDWNVLLTRACLLNKNVGYDGDQMVAALTHPRSTGGVDARAVIINVDVNHSLPGFLLDFSKAHIVFGKRWKRRILDQDTGLITLADVALTQVEINTMRWWCCQPAIEPQDIFIYPGDNGFRADEDAAVHSRFHIENEQSGGFIISVLISAFGRDANHVLHSFIRSPYILPIMTSRLQHQCILIHGNDSESLQLAYTACQKRVFAAVIPLVRYDYRLAHLIALGSPDSKIRRLKAQLAVFLTLKNDWEVVCNHSTPIMTEGWGWGRSSWGDLWRVFGMWKLIYKDCQDFEALDESLISDQGGFVSLPGSAVALFLEITVTLERTLKKLDEEFGVGLPPHRIADESESLSDTQMDEVSRSLLSAFLNELVVTHRVLADDGVPHLEHTIFKTGTTVKLVAWGSIDALSLEQFEVLQQDGEVYGVCAEFSKAVPFKGMCWAFVPHDLVREALLR
ncbi:hypothetical protein FPHYL_13591 [Fusarium phyllophilum]|uniref:Uncharacterized protein n=1 Tax=Fusarium phyllophilum TaxID=47803 RepID=A0A8H5IFP0_9HYPO|nr:hypothetical protein FPHYL_13591 [Fusarium phyllophilum]